MFEEFMLHFPKEPKTEYDAKKAELEKMIKNHLDMLKFSEEYKKFEVNRFETKKEAELAIQDLVKIFKD